LPMRARSGAAPSLARGKPPEAGRVPSAAGIADGAEQLGGRPAAVLDVGRDADTEELGVLALDPGLLLLPELVVPGELEGPVEARLVVSGVGLQPRRQRRRLGERRDEVHPP